MKDIDQELREMVSSPTEKRPVMFIAHVNQGEGCKYMISCGETLWKLKAIDWGGALKEVKARVIGEVDEDGDLEDGYYGESELEAIELFEIVNSQQMPLSKWYSEAQDIMDNKKIADKEWAEKMELKRLKGKYE